MKKYFFLLMTLLLSCHFYLSNAANLIVNLKAPKEIKGDVSFMVDLKGHTSLGIGGPASILARPSDIESLKYILYRTKEMGMRILPIGGGTNMLVSDKGVDAVVICLKDLGELRFIDDDTVDSAMVDAGSGVSLHRLITAAAQMGLCGLEPLSGIPGSVGGAIAGNAGSYGAEIKDYLVNITVMGYDGTITTINKDEIIFGYRTAEIKDCIIVGARFHLIRARAIDESPMERIKSYLLKKRSTQPIKERSAGCVFKNLKDVSAGKLIDMSGLKGTSVGGIMISHIHANFFINTGGGACDDFLKLMDIAHERIFKRYGIALEPEIRIIR